MHTENQHGTLSNIFENAGNYLESKVDLLKLKAVKKMSDVTSSLVTKLTIVLLIAFVFFMANIGLAMWVGDMMEKMYYGFFIVAGGYIIIALILYGFRRQLFKTPLHNRLIKMMLKEDE
jgi:hypothetical protein